MRAPTTRSSRGWRRASGLALLGLGPLVFYYVFGHRGYFDILAARRAAGEAFGDPFWLSAEVWAEAGQGAVYPSLFLFALSGIGTLVLLGAGRRTALLFGIALALWGLYVAARSFPPFFAGSAFVQTPWGPFVKAVLGGVLPGLWLALRPPPWLLIPNPRRDRARGSYRRAGGWWKAWRRGPRSAPRYGGHT
ncbi:MAG: hypothetical protein ACTSUD_00010 [Alphaproteobacteria bacterium]